VQSICRNVVIILEGVCAFLLSAFYAVRDADFGVPNFALWSTDQRNHLGLCTHSPLAWSREDLMNELNDEQVEEFLVSRRTNKARENKEVP
jgi:hypothetical protein